MKKLLLILLSTLMLLILPGAYAQEEPAISIDITLSTEAVAVGEEIQANWTATGGTGQYKYDYYWTVVENNTEYHPKSEWEITDTTSILTPRYGQTGSIQIIAYDEAGNQGSKTVEFTITGSEPVEPLKVELNLNQNSVAAGQPIEASWVSSGGTSPHKYDVQWVLYSTGQIYLLRDEKDSSSTSGSYTPQYGDGGHIAITCKDALGREITTIKEFTITGAPEITKPQLTLSLDKTTAAVDLKESLTATWETTGGVPPYAYDFVWAVKESGDNELVDSNFNCSDTTSTFQPQYGKSGVIGVVVRDSLGQWAEKQVEFALTGASDPLAIKPILSTDSVAVGQPITGSWTATGGIPPYVYEYSWVVMDEHDTHYVRSDSETSRLKDTFYPPCGNRGELRLQVHDAVNRRASATIPFAITGSKPTEPLTLTVSVSPEVAAVDQGQSLKATWQASGGTPPYTYHTGWYVSDSSDEYGTYVTGSHEISDTSELFTPRYGTNGRISVGVTDSQGRRANGEATFALTGETAVEPLNATLTLDPQGSVAAGTPITANWQVTAYA